MPLKFITDAEYHLILALRKMPHGWCDELGTCVMGEGDHVDTPEIVGWGTSLYFAFQEYAKERGET